MTVASAVNKSGPYIGDGVVTVFPRTFKLYDSDHIRVLQTIGTTITELTGGYTVDGVGNDAGNVTFDVAPVVGAEIVLLREVPNVQNSDYSSQGDVSPEQIEADLDLLAMQLQDVNEKADRSFAQPVTGASYTAGAVPVFDDLGFLIEGPDASQIVAAEALAEAAGVAATAAEVARDEALGSFQFVQHADKAAAILSEPGADVQFLLLAAYSASVDPQRGGAVYRRSDATEAAIYDARVKLFTANGVWFVLHEEDPMLAMAGGLGRSDFEANTGTDEKAVIDALVAYCRTEDKAVGVDGYYRYHGEFAGFTNDRFRGVGRDQCGILFQMDNTQSGFTTLYDGLSAWDMELCGDLIEDKSGGDNGHIGCVTRIGTYVSGIQVSSLGFDFRRLKVSRTPNTAVTSYKSLAMTIFGDARRGILRDIEVTGRHTHGLQAHWTGDFTAVGNTVTSTDHPHDFLIDNISFGPQVEIALVLSSVGHVQIGRASGVGQEVVLRVLAGDEGPDFATYGHVGSNITFENLHFTEIVGNADGDEVFEWTSLYTSKFRDEEGQDRKRQLDLNLHFENVYLHTAASLPKAIRSFAAVGNVQMDNVTVKGFDVAYDSVNSLAQTRIHFADTDGEVHADDSDHITLTGKSDLNDPEAADRYGVKLEGARYAVALDEKSADIVFSSGDTSIVLSAGISRDIERGRKITLVGTDSSDAAIEWTTYATQYVEEGNVNVPVEELPFTFKTCTATIDKFATNIHVHMVPRGVRTGIQAEGVTFNIDGIGPQGIGRFGIELVDNAVLIGRGLNISGNGRGRTQNPSFAVYDFWLKGNSLALVTDSVLGSTADNLEAVIDVNDTSRFQASGCRVMETTNLSQGAGTVAITNSVTATNAAYP